MTKQAIHTNNAPAAIGPYSQAIKLNNLVFLSGQVPFDPKTNELVSGDIAAETHQVFKNINEVVKAANGRMENIVKLTIFVTDLTHFATVNSVMAEYFAEPYPARSTVQVSALPKGVRIEIEAILSV
jgi:reactive intermediate/imine deaminase